MEAISKLAKGLDSSGTTKIDVPAAVALLGVPLWYEGLDYFDSKSPDVRACKKQFGSHGHIQASRLEAFVGCANIATWMFTTSIGIKPAALAHLPKPLRKHRAALAKLAKDHAVLQANYSPAGPGDTIWVIYAVAKDRDGHVRITALLTASTPYEG